MSESIFIQNNDEIIELKGKDLQAFLDDRAEIKAQADAVEAQRLERATKLASAITKLKALGLTETEAKIIIGIE